MKIDNTRILIFVEMVASLVGVVLLTVLIIDILNYA